MNYVYTQHESKIQRFKGLSKSMRRLWAVIPDKPVVTVLGDGKGRMKNRPLELPMSPGSPSQLSLSESEPYYR